MAKAKKHTLEHIIFGTCTVIGAWLLSSGDEPYLEVTCFVDNRKQTKKLLAAQDYWLSDAAEVKRVYELYHAKELLRRKTLAAKSRKVDANAKGVAPDWRKRALESTQNEIDQLEAHIEDLNLDLPEIADEIDYETSYETDEDASAAA